MNKRHIRELAKAIRNSRSFDQGEWVHAEYTTMLNQDRFDWCGTPACIAGHAAWLHEGRKPVWMSQVEELAMKYMDISFSLSYFLFDGDADGWPPLFKNRFQNTDDRNEQKQAAADMLEWLLTDEGQDWAKEQEEGW